MKDFAYRIAFTNNLLNNSFREYFKDDFENLRTISTPYGEVGTILYHIFNGTNIWLNRIANENALIGSYDDLRSKKEFFSEWIKVDQRFMNIIQNYKIDYTKILQIKTKSGNEYKISVEDALLHLSHHNFQHRGNLGSIIRLNDLKPLPGLDWIDANKIQ